MLGSAALTPTQLGGRADWNRIAYQVVSSLSLRVFKGRLGDHLPEVICGVPVATQPLYLPISAILTGGGCHSGPGGQWSRWVALNRGPGQSGRICGGAALPSPPWPPFLRWPLDTARPLLHSDIEATASCPLLLSLTLSVLISDESLALPPIRDIRAKTIWVLLWGNK